MKTQDNIQTMITSINTNNKISKLQTKPHTVSGSDLYLSKTTSTNIGLNPLKVLTDVTSYFYPHTSRLQTQMQFITYLSCDFEPDINLPK